MENNQLQTAILNQQHQQINQQLSQVDSNIEELKKLLDNVHDLSKVKDKSKSLFYIGGGLYLEGELKPVKEILMNVGAGVTVKKPIDKSIKVLENQIKDLEKLKDKMEQDLNKISLKMASVS